MPRRHGGRLIRSRHATADLDTPNGGPSVMFVFHSVTGQYEVKDAGNAYLMQPFKLGETGATGQNYRFTDIENNILNLAGYFDEYKITGVKVTCHMNRQPVVALATVMSPIVYVAVDPWSAWYDRVDTSARVPDYSDNEWIITEIVADPGTERHYFRGDSLTFQKWIPMTEIEESYNQFRASADADNLPNYTARLGLEPRLHASRWHLLTTNSTSEFLNSAFNHGAPAMHILLAQNNGQNIKMMYEYEWFLHFRGATNYYGAKRFGNASIDVDNAGATAIAVTIPRRRLRSNEELRQHFSSHSSHNVVVRNGRTHLVPKNLESCDGPPFQLRAWTRPQADPDISPLNTQDNLYVPPAPDDGDDPYEEKDDFDEKDMDSQGGDPNFQRVRAPVHASAPSGLPRGGGKISRSMTNIGLPPVGSLNLNKK